MTYYGAIGEWLAIDVFQMDVMTSVIGYIAIWIVIAAFQTPIAETFRGLHDIRLAVWLDGNVSGVVLALAVATVLVFDWKLDFRLAIAAAVCASFISLLIGVNLLWRRRHVFQGPGGIEHRLVLSMAAPLFVTNVTTHGINQLSLWIVALYLGAQDVALYGAAWRLVNMLALPLMLMNMTVNPMIAELIATREHARLQNALRGSATLAAIPTLLVLSSYILLGEEILGMIFGSGYEAAAPILSILSGGMLINAWTGSCTQLLAMAGYQRILMGLTIITGVASTIATIYATQTWGMVGAACAISGGRVVHNLLGWLLAYRLSGLWTHATFHPGFIQMALRRVLKQRPQQK